ncbi:MAG: DUF5714 domain-containing protein [Anaerotardibacter sp.]
MSNKENSYFWAIKLLTQSQENDPVCLLETCFANENCVAFGPVHHFLVGACLLTGYAHAKKLDDEILSDYLTQLNKESVKVPGAACALWGICGAAISAGMAYAIIAENAPLKIEGWSEGQTMVAEIAEKIAVGGAPRCCKRDSRWAVEIARNTFARDFGVNFGDSISIEELSSPCIAASSNTVCIHDKCPFF